MKSEILTGRSVPCVNTNQLEIGKRDVVAKQSLKPQWRMTLELDAKAIKQGSPIKMLLEAIKYIPGVTSQIGRIETVLAELYTNALDHGVLKLDSIGKDSSQGFASFYRLRKKKLALLKKGFIHIELDCFFEHGGGYLQIGVKDSGRGFDYSNKNSQINLHAKTDMPIMPHGRGLTLARSLCDSLIYHGCGNKVTAICSWKTAH